VKNLYRLGRLSAVSRYLACRDIRRPARLVAAAIRRADYADVPVGFLCRLACKKLIPSYGTMRHWLGCGGLVRMIGWMPLRWPGLVLLIAGLWLAVYVGRAQADYLVYAASLTAATLVLGCAVAVLTGALLLRRSVRGLPCGLAEAIDTMHATRTSFRFSRLAAWPLVEVRLRWDEPAQVEVELNPAGKWFEEVITARERGRHAAIVRCFTVEDILGLTAVSFRLSWRQPLLIAPAPAAASAELAASFGQGDAYSHPAANPMGDLVEMRQYGHGDPLRHVLWKSFARSRRLLVRMPERAVVPRPASAAFLVAGALDEATAGTARLYLERGALGPDFVFSADGAARPTQNTAEALDQIIDSVRARQIGGTSLETLSAQVDSARLTSCVLFAPAVDGPWRAHVAAFARRLPAPPTVIIGVRGSIAPPPSRGRLARFFIAPGAIDADAPTFAALQALRGALEAEGLRVHVLDHQSGQVL